MDTGEQVTVTGNKLCRSKHNLTRERVKLLAKCTAKKVSTEPPLYAIKAEYIEKLRLDDENFNIPFLKDFGKTNPKGNKRKIREDDDEKKKSKKKKKQENGDKEKKNEEPKVSPEERRRLIEEERAKKKRERQEERDNQKKMAAAEAAFTKEWMKPREDLELADSKDLPTIPPVTTLLPVALFGDVIQVLEFFYLFGDHVDVSEEFPEGIQIDSLEKSLTSNKQEGLFGDLVMFLLKLIFALQEEEDEEEVKLAENYNFSYTPATLNLSHVTMIPSVTWHTAVETREDEALPWMGATQAHYFTHYYLGVPLSKLQLDTYTVTEILRLHILGAGGRSNGSNYYGRWRFNNRGMFTDADDPCVELRNRDPSLMSMLAISNVFDLPPASKLTVLTTLVNQVLTYAQFREIIEECLDGSRDAKKEWKSFGTELQKKEKEEAAVKYREWLASRIKIKEDKKKKKKGRVSELKEGDTTIESDRSMVDNDTDVSMAEADQDPENKPPEKTSEERAAERKLAELQDHALYIAFREISCKLKVNPLGVDRYFRKYWSFHSLPGIFVEESTLNVSSLYSDGTKSNGVSSCNGESKYELTSASQLDYDMRTNGVKEEDIRHDVYYVNQTDNLPVPGTVQTNGLNGHHQDDKTGILTVIDPATMTVDEIVQLKLREAIQKYGDPASTYQQLRQTPGFRLLSEDQSAWSHLRSEAEIREVLELLNPRGEREKELCDNINKDLNRIINDITDKPVVGRAKDGEDGVKVEDSEIETEEQKTALEILKKTSSEKLIEASLREQICDLENRIFEANFGSAKVKNRMAWRQEIEDFWLDDSAKRKVPDGDVPEIPKPIVHQRLMALRASQQPSSDDDSSLTSGSSTVVSRRSIILKLSQALLSVEKGVPAKYLSYPLGDTASGRSVNPDRIEGEIDQVSRWRDSLSCCTSLSQILLHLASLDSSVVWSKSILKTNCRVCRRKCDPDKILLCDSCDRGQHLYCLKPKLKSIPAGKWYCRVCKPSTRSSRTRRKVVEVSSDEEESEEEEEESGSEEEFRQTRSKRKSVATPTPPKSLAEKVRLSQQIVKLMQEDENGWPFLYPVDGEQIPDYYKIIPNPMDLDTVQKKLKAGRYRKIDSFIEDVNQIFLNCHHYNQSRAPAYKAGTRLKKLFSDKLSEFGLT